MPELPEVETIRRGLTEAIIGKRFTHADVRLPKIFHGPVPAKELVGRRVEKLTRRGKLLIIEVSGGFTLLIHLKMTGQLIYRQRGQIALAGGHPIPTVSGDLPAKVTHVIFTFTGGSELFFNDLRQFGYIKFLPTVDLPDVPLMRAFGPEPLSRAFTAVRFNAMLARRPTAKLKPLLLDQTFLAGLGNIYVDEALNLAKLHPLRPAGTLRPAQRAALHAAIKQVLRTSLRYGGTSDNTYVTIRGAKGDYLRVARAYHRTDLPCRACGTPIRRITVAGRGTHYCPNCQRLPRVAKK